MVGWSAVASLSSAADAGATGLDSPSSAASATPETSSRPTVTGEDREASTARGAASSETQTALSEPTQDPPMVRSDAPPTEPLGGGYWGPLGKAPPAPQDGAWQRTSGSVILPLGILRAGAGALSVYASRSPRCESWLDGNESTCNGLRVYGYWGLGFGVAMAAAGAAFLAIGVAKGRRYAEWERQWSFRASVVPGASNVGFRVRF